MEISAKERIHRIVSDVFGIPRNDVDDGTSPDDVETWDSEAHINLILSLEEEFGISLSPEEALQMLSVRLVRMILAEHGVGDGN